MVPDTNLKVRMGIQPILFPNKAGGSAVLDSRAADIVASYAFKENPGLTGMWLRPSNDNFQGADEANAGYLDNLDLFAVTLPITYAGLEITPWVMYGMQGRNTFASGNNWTEGDPNFSFNPCFGTPDNVIGAMGKSSIVYRNLFWAGLPVGCKFGEGWNVEFDFNYGYVEEMGRHTAYKGVAQTPVRGSSMKREVWLAMALVEYQFDWITPGIFGWYADDDNIKNGSERMSALVPWGYFTSFMSDGNLAWAWEDYQTSHAGTWGIGLQLKDMTFIEDIDHTFRAAWWGGANSPATVKYMEKSYSWNYGSRNFDGPYMTTNDAMLEFNLVNNYKMYENFNINLELGYVANFMDNDTWKKAGKPDSAFSRQDIWIIQPASLYNF